MVDLKSFDLNLLRVLNVLFELRSITKTARRLGVSQPMVSISLKKLRQSLGDELFVHSGSEMIPTARALAFEEPLRNIIQEIRHQILEEAAFDPEREGSVQICLSDIGELEFVPNLVRRAQLEAPGMVIRSVVVDPPELARRLESGEVDLAIGYFPDLVSSNFQQQLLFEHRFACMARRGHPDIHDQISMDEFLSLRHVVVEHPTRRRDLFELTLDKAGLSRSVGLYLSNHVTMPFILQDSDLIGTIPRPLANKLAPLCDLQIFEPPLVTAPIVVKPFWHRRYQRSPRHTWLRGIIREISQNKPYLTA
ncbi:DNA-binding transcriptional regulator, LysR family [Hyphomicrobium facile]|uniref:DNA-binding transcriptional regulator, LysR family n=2 Tax=Hyphomicrobium facile TaxID=51670 RepID=A0A1I7NVV1_9HYPH|nr:DNA-binding transcriptional regulator, LysR family [Hyphomicrobium facile]